MKVLIVSPGRLPVPACNGGAVETLIELLLDYNEEYMLNDIYVISIWNKEAEARAYKYKHTKFIYIKQRELMTFIVNHHILPFRILDYFFAKKIVKKMKIDVNFFDRIIIQNELVTGSALMKKWKGYYIYHAHNDTVSSSKKDVIFLRSCDKVIAISNFLAGQLQCKVGLTNTEVVYNGIDTSLFYREKYIDLAVEKRKMYGIHKEDMVIAYAGRLVEEKGIHVLLDALGGVPSECQVVLLIIGSLFFGNNKKTAYIRKLEKKCIKNSLSVVFTGYVSHQDMPIYYAMADIGCVPSLWNEPFGLTVAEQMAMELPVIVTDSGAIPEIVDSTCGYIFKRDKGLIKNIRAAIIELKYSPEKRIQMGKSARMIIKKKFNNYTFCKHWFDSI